jgi:hypothetical protein
MSAPRRFSPSAAWLAEAREYVATDGRAHGVFGQKGEFYFERCRPGRTYVYRIEP